MDRGGTAQEQPDFLAELAKQPDLLNQQVDTQLADKFAGLLKKVFEQESLLEIAPKGNSPSARAEQGRSK
jgi:hypothetical protein